MKQWIVVALILISVNAYAADVEIKTFVNDYANVFSEEERAQIEALAVEIFDSKNAEYAVVTVQSLEGKPIETYAIELAQGKLGDTEKDNGLLLLIALEEKKYRFEVGSGLEGTLNDAKVGDIGRTYIVPYFKEAQYGAGTIAASSALRDLIVNGIQPEVTPIDKGGGWKMVIIALLIWIIVIAILAYAQRNVKKEKYHDAAIAASSMYAASDWWKRGGGGGGNFGGGFGGGGFSGGGAGGGW